jgi:hypothetical protein
MANIGEVALKMIFYRDQLKFYHWAGTDLYSRHIASDSLVNSLTEKLDEFIETMQGGENKKLIIPKTSMIFTVETDVSIIKLLENFKIWLINSLPTLLNSTRQNTDLLNIRDEILGNVNKTLYLFTLS